MGTGAVISVTATTGLLDAIVEKRGDPDEVLRGAGLSRRTLADPDHFIASSAFARLLEEAARSTGDDCFGLHFGERFDSRDAGALAYLVVNSPTVAIAMENLERYFHLHNSGAWISFTIEGDNACFRYLHADAGQPPTRQHNEFSMAVLVRTYGVLAGSRWRPRAIQFAHAAPHRISEHLRVFGERLQFAAPANALVFEHDFVERAVPAADEKLYRVLKRFVERLLEDAPRRDDLPGVVARAIGEAMREGTPSLERIAGKLAMSPRTLERRLKEQGASYRELLDATRSRFAMSYMNERGRSLSEIAFLLGYSEVSAFNRAFKRWTGSTPSGYRGS